MIKKSIRLNLAKGIVSSKILTCDLDNYYIYKKNSYLVSNCGVKINKRIYLFSYFNLNKPLLLLIQLKLALSTHMKY